MILDPKSKKEILRVLIIASFTEIVIIAALLRAEWVQLSLWRALVGSFTIITGLTLFYAFITIPFERKNKFLRLAVLANPAATAILSGVCMIVWDISRYDWLLISCSVSAVLSFLASLFFLIVHVIINRSEKITFRH